MRAIIFLIILVGTVSSCIVSKDSRILKKNTKDWRESKMVLSGYLDTPMAGIFLTLRENGKFEYTSSGIFKGFSAGTWSMNGDTISLNYLNSEQTVIDEESFLMDRNTSTLQSLKKSQGFRMRYTIHSDQ